MHQAPNTGRNVRFLTMEKHTLTLTTMNILVTSLLVCVISRNTISKVKAELTKRYEEVYLTLLVTVKIFHNGSRGRLRHMARTLMHVK